MGMDVYGKEPENETGRYFRNNVWWWRPLAEYVQEVHPSIAAGCQYWHTNDGDGLDAEGAKALGHALLQDLKTGRAAAWEDQRNAHLQNLPKIMCVGCRGAGELVLEKPTPGSLADELTKMVKSVSTGFVEPEYGKVKKCNSCEGTGEVDAWEKSYPFDLDNIKEFAEFCIASGGFEIW